jgi:hypothetical protein
MVSSVVDLPVIEFAPYLNDPKSPEAIAECKKVTRPVTFH